MVSPQTISAPQPADVALIAAIEAVKDAVSGVRGVRAAKNISPREPLVLEVVGQNPLADYDSLLRKMAGVSEVKTVTAKSEGTSSFLVGTTEFAVEIGALIDTEAEIAKAEAELKHLEGFLSGVEKKLNNARFVENAPEAVVALERKKQSDATAKIALLRETLAALRK